MEDLKQTVASNLTALRTAAGMTQAELAERLNYSDKAVSKWERAESLPDVAVLKEIAGLFSVSLDYLTEPEHPDPLPAASRHDRPVIVALSVALVWLAATLAFVVLDLLPRVPWGHWLCFVCAVPVSAVVMLIFDCVWFSRRRSWLIISLLLWSALAFVYLLLLAFDKNWWVLFLLGVPGEVLTLLWDRLQRWRASRR